MNYEQEVKILNQFYSNEENNILKMAQELFKLTNIYKKQTGQSKVKRYWIELIRSGCKYTYITLKHRYLTIKNFPSLLQVKELPISFTCYCILADYANRLGNVKEIIRFKAEQKRWTSVRVKKEIIVYLNTKGGATCLCVCPTCGQKHRKNGK